MDGCKYREIAAAMKISIGAVKSQISDAKAHLRTLLNPPGRDGEGT